MPLITAQMKKTYESNLYIQFIPKEVSEDELK